MTLFVQTFWKKLCLCCNKWFTILIDLDVKGQQQTLTLLDSIFSTAFYKSSHYSIKENYFFASDLCMKSWDYYGVPWATFAW